MSETTRVCRRCTLELAIDTFPIDGRIGRGHRQSVCRPCRNAANRQRRAADRAFRRGLPPPTDDVAQQLRRELADLRARIAALRTCVDRRCSLCATCLAALHDEAPA
jgi:hypothetical protein